jgi:hypothetical protein
MKLKLCFLVLSAVILHGCSTVATAPRTDDYYERLDRPPQSPDASLFAADSAVMSDEHIRNALAHRYAPHPQNRIAVMALGMERWYGWSDELARIASETQTALVGKLRTSPIVFDASYLPSFLMPGGRTVAHYREAAARYQADLLLVYRSSCRTYDRYRLLAADSAKSFCTVEAALLDVRTGLVPFSVVSTRDFETTRRSGTSYAEMMRHAELAALADALREAGDAVVGYLQPPA